MTLLSKLEAATGPDRELDAEIAVSAKQVPDGFEDKILPWVWTSRYDDREWEAPHYTASIDAALTLLPDGWRVNLSEWDHEALRKRGPWQCVLSPEGAGHFDFNTVQETRSDFAPTPALALCIAIMKARAE